MRNDIEIIDYDLIGVTDFNLYEDNTYYRLIILGWKSIPILAMFLDITEDELCSIVLKYNAIIKRNMVLFTNINDFYNTKERLETIIVMNKLGE